MQSYVLLCRSSEFSVILETAPYTFLHPEEEIRLIILYLLVVLLWFCL